MPNFDLFERLLIHCLIGIVQPNHAANQIYNLPEEEKVQLVKNKSEDDVLSFLNRCRDALRSRFSENAYFHSSDNNMIGNDIYDSASNQHVEIKSGQQMTDANCGLKIVSWALNDENNFIKENMTEGMRNRKDIFLGGGSNEEIEINKGRQMDALSNFLTQQTQDVAGERLSHFFKSISRGITKGDAIMKSHNNVGSYVNFPLKLMCDWEHGLVEYDKAFDRFETILIEGVGRTGERCQLNVVGQSSGVKGLLYPNYKNSLTLSSGDKIPAKYWVKTPCFHVWITGRDD